MMMDADEQDELDELDELGGLPDEVQAQFDHLDALEPGWHGDDSPPPSTAALAWANSLCEALAFGEFSMPGILASPSGGVTLEWHDIGLEIAINADGKTGDVYYECRVELSEDHALALAQLGSVEGSLGLY